MEIKNILITGGAGYVGISLVKEVLAKYSNSNIIVLDNLSKGRIENFNELLTDNNKVLLETVDIRDYVKIDNLLKKYQPEIVIHLAAIVDAFSTNRKGKDEECIDVNYSAAVKFAELCKKNNSKIFIFQSTVSLYSQGEEIKEDSKKNPLSVYGKAKMHAEREILSLADLNFRACALRPATVVGYNKGFRYETIINLACIKSVYGLPLSIFSSALKGNKSYIHLKDNVDAIIFAIGNIEIMNGQSYNVSSFDTNLEEVLKKIESFLNRKINYNLIYENGINQQVYTINADKIRNLGFVPRKDFDESIEENLTGLLNFKEIFNKNNSALHEKKTFNFIETGLKGLIEIIPNSFEDSRGIFCETFNAKEFEEHGIPTNFVQDNQSISRKGVLRGLHFQKSPFSQGKLVRVVKGSVLDVAVDIRKNSSTYGSWHSVFLSEKNKKMLWIPEGFAHGFLVLENNTIFNYKCTNYYNRDSESGIRWNDHSLKIDWQLENLETEVNIPIVNERDSNFPLFNNNVYL